MILRQSDRALADALARDNLRCQYLWTELDRVQAQISDVLERSGNSTEYRRLSQTEREILAQLDKVDDR